MQRQHPSGLLRAKQEPPPYCAIAPGPKGDAHWPRAHPCPCDRPLRAGSDPSPWSALVTGRPPPQVSPAPCSSCPDSCCWSREVRGPGAGPGGRGGAWCLMWAGIWAWFVDNRPRPQSTTWSSSTAASMATGASSSSTCPTLRSELSCMWGTHPHSHPLNLREILQDSHHPPRTLLRKFGGAGSHQPLELAKGACPTT